MKHSIKTKLFFLFAGLLAVFLFAGTLCSVLFLQRYYIAENKPLLAEAAGQVRAALGQEPEQLQDTVKAIDRAESIGIAIADADGSILLTSYSQKTDDGGSKLPKNIMDLIGSGAQTVYGKVTAAGGGSARIVYACQTDDGRWIVLTKQIRGLTESAAIANRFYFFSGVVSLILGGTVVYFFARRIVRPVQEMNDVAKSIARLEFETITDIHSDDELGQLAGSINVISEKLQESIRSLEKDIAYQKQLTRDTSHELKTPIGVIKGYAEGLIYGVADDPASIRDYCQTIVTECDRMDALVKDMLAFSALEARDAAPQKTCFSAETLLRDVADSFAPLLEGHHIRCSFECAEELTASADYALMQRALGNFLTNAVRYGGENGYVRLSARQEGQKVRFAVFNTGPGISQEELPRIWDVFYKVDKARTREKGGHGLGLAIVRSIAALHGGEVGVENQKGGIEFSITV